MSFIASDISLCQIRSIFRSFFGSSLALVPLRSLHVEKRKLGKEHIPAELKLEEIFESMRFA